MRKRKSLSDEPVVLTEEEKAQCQKNAFSWQRMHQDLFAVMEIPFWDVTLAE